MGLAFGCGFNNEVRMGERREELTARWFPRAIFCPEFIDRAEISARWARIHTNRGQIVLQSGQDNRRAYASRSPAYQTAARRKGRRISTITTADTYAVIPPRPDKSCLLRLCIAPVGQPGTHTGSSPNGYKQ